MQAVILAVSVNAVITGQFIRRTYEFGVYRALGKSKGWIRRKITKELLLIDLLAVMIGFVLIFLLTYLLNELVYGPKGMDIPYISQMGMEGAALSNVLVIVPMIFLKSRQMCKADVTKF